jgi:thimet oligopeptidase
MPVLRLLTAALAICVLARPAQGQPLPTAYDGITSVAELQRATKTLIDQADKHLDSMLRASGRRTVQNTLVPYDRAQAVLGRAGNLALLVRDVHPDVEMRHAAAAIRQAVAAKRDQWLIDERVFAALSGIDASTADAQAKFYIGRELDAARLAGAALDQAVRKRVLDLRDELTAARRAFEENIRTGQGTVVVEHVTDLAGLPKDFVSSHPPGSGGRITLTTQPPDRDPVLQYATTSALRRRMWEADQNIGYPANVDALKHMLRIQREIALLLGYRSWADYDAKSRMVGSVENADRFLTQVTELSAPGAKRDYLRLLKRKQRDDSGVSTLDPWDVRYYIDLLRKEQFAMDSQVVRQYFPYDVVREGVLRATEALFGVSYQRITARVWHESVEVYEASFNGKPLGRIYLDMHPRAGKISGTASTYFLRQGADGDSLPETVIVARLPGGTGAASLLVHDQVRTFFHEFGHAINNLFAGHQQWSYLTRFYEPDFGEVPSSMLEEWVYDATTLALMGKHYQSGEPIPSSLVNQIRQSSELGRAITMRNTLALSRLALALHSQNEPNFDVMTREVMTKFSMLRYVDGTHKYAGFPHLANGNYTAGYYTYLWSQVIAKDLFSRFDQRRMLDPAVGHQFAETIFRPGGSRPAAESVQQFLRRPFTVDAWARWVNGAN